MSLRELYIGNQKTSKKFTFDEYSLATISSTLQLLDMPNVNLVNSKPLYYLENLHTLNLQKNKIEDLQGQVAPFLMTCQRLKNLQLQQNPVVKTFKYRDQVVLMTHFLQELDGKTIKAQERQYLNTLA